MPPAKLDAVEVSIKFPYLFELKGNWIADDTQRKAAWELYVELATRIATVELPPDDGLVREALSSLHALFPTTREILRRHGPALGRPVEGSALSIGQIAVSVLNQGVRPFLAKWHPALSGWEQTRKPEVAPVAHERAWPREKKLRKELRKLQRTLHQYAATLEAGLGLSRSLLERPPKREDA